MIFALFGNPIFAHWAHFGLKNAALPRLSLTLALKCRSPWGLVVPPPWDSRESNIFEAKVKIINGGRDFWKHLTDFFENLDSDLPPKIHQNNEKSPEGIVRAIYDTGLIYEGQMSANCERNGFGVLY